MEENLKAIFGEDYLENMKNIDRYYDEMREEHSRLDKYISDIQHIIELYPKKYYKRKIYKIYEQTLKDRRKVKDAVNFIATYKDEIKSMGYMMFHISKYIDGGKTRKYKLRILKECDFSYSKNDIWSKEEK